MIVSAIAAVARNGVIGYRNQLPWHLPADLRFFKRTTLNHHVIMGRKSFLSIGRPLPRRINIVISRNPRFTAAGVQVAHSVPEALFMAHQAGETEAFIIGGGQIYQASHPFWHRLYLTEVDATPEGDAFFPEIDWSEWRVLREEPHAPDAPTELGYTFKLLERQTRPLAWKEEVAIGARLHAK